MRRALALLIASLLITGCANSDKSQNSNNSELRIIVAAAGAGEILKEIGLADSIVGVDERNSHSSSAAVVTTAHSFNFEKVISLQPTHVILDSLTGTGEVKAQFQNNGIRIVNLLTAENIAQIYNKYLALGRAFNKTSKAEAASKALQGKFSEFAADTRSYRIAFLYLRGTNAIYFVGGKGSGADSLIAAVGSVDVGAKTLKNPFSPLSAEVMRKLNPEVLLLMKNGYESVGGLKGLQKLPGLSETIAVKQGNVVLIEDRELLDFGPDTIDVLSQIKEQLRQIDAA